MTEFGLILRNLRGSRGRYGLVLLLSALLFSVVAVSWCTIRAAERGLSALRQTYGGRAIVDCYETDASGSSLGINSGVTPEDLKQLEKLPHVAHVELTGCFFYTDRDCSMITLNGGDFIRGWNFCLVGYNPEADTPFRNLDPAAVLEGRVYGSNTECVVSELTAEQYGLKLGDVLEITHIRTESQARYTLVGIVDHNALEPRFYDPALLQNVFYTSMEGAEPFAEAREDVSVEFYSDAAPESPPVFTGYNNLVELDSYQNFNAFAREVQKLRREENGHYYRFYASYVRVDAFDEIANPLMAAAQRFSRLGMLALLLFVGVSFTTAVVGLRARRQQFGTLRAMGMPRRQIALEYGAEQAVVYLGGVLLGCALAALAMALRPEALPALDAAALGSMAEAAAGSLVLLALLMAVALIGVLRFRPMKLLRS